MAGRFPLLTDACVNDHLVRALVDRGWGSCGPSTCIPREPRTRSSSSARPRTIAIRWLREARCFRGMVAWPVETYEHRSIGDVVEDFEAVAKEEDPFAYPVRHLKVR